MNLGVRLEHRNRLRAGCVHGVMTILVAAFFLGLPGRHVAVPPAFFLAMTPAGRMPLGAMEMVVSIMIVAIVIAVMGQDRKAIVVAVMMLDVMIVTVFIVIVVPVGERRSHKQASGDTGDRQIL